MTSLASLKASEAQMSDIEPYGPLVYTLFKINCIDLLIFYCNNVHRDVKKLIKPYCFMNTNINIKAFETY